MEHSINIDILIEEFARKLQENQGAIFVGAGVSKADPTTLPGWGELLTPLAKEIGIEIKAGDDLPQIAQFIVNAHTGNRGPLLQYFKEKFISSHPLNNYHINLSRTNINTVWTTNYDCMLEKAFNGFLFDVKSEDDHISRSVAAHNLEIIKMHGCINNSPFESIVITSEDYEDYFVKRPATSRRLENDLLTKSLLFIGYGYNDPNLQNIVIEARRLTKNATRRHFIIMKCEETDDARLRQFHWAKDLKRSGIFTAFIDKHSELETALFKISQKSKGPTVYTTGSHAVNKEDYKSYGTELAKISKAILIDGQQTSGICHDIVLGFSEECRLKKADLMKRVRIFPNPYAVDNRLENDPSLIPQLKAMRSPLLNSTQVMIAFPGGMGTKAEIDVAKHLGVPIIPVPLKKDDSSHQLLADKDISRFISVYDTNYIKLASSLKLTPQIVASLISKIIDK